MRVKLYSFGLVDKAAFFYHPIVTDDESIQRELDDTIDTDLISEIDIKGLFNKVLQNSYAAYKIHDSESLYPHYIVIMREDSPYFNVSSFTEKTGTAYEQKRSKLRRDYFVPILAKAHTSDPNRVKVIREDD